MKTKHEVAESESGRAYIGGYYPTRLKRQLKRIARRERRSLNGLLEIFLEEGVKHHRTGNGSGEQERRAA